MQVGMGIMKTEQKYLVFRLLFINTNEKLEKNEWF